MATKSDPKTYTKPELREKIKDRVKKGDKGGKPDQWSARKAQLVTQEYEKAGGGYKKPRNENQKSLKKWGDEKWQTEDGSAQARRGDKTKRYLPEKAWEKLSPAEKKETDRKKVEGSRKGKQFVPNTPAASAARKKAAGSKPAAKKAVKKTAAKIASQSAAKSAASKRTPAKNTAAKKTAAKKTASKTAAKKTAKRASR